MKVICAGLQKTGTKSMACALRTLGYDVHDVFQQYQCDKELWLKVRNNSETLEDYKKILKDVDAVTDFPGCAFWEQILEAFPEAKVILTIRSSEDEWCRSVTNHCKKVESTRPISRSIMSDSVLNRLLGPSMTDYHQHAETFCCAALGVPSFSATPIEAMLRIKYREHNAYVKLRCPEDRLLVFNTKDGWGPLCEFLSVPVPNIPFPRLNIKGEIVQQVARGEFDDQGLMKAVRREASIRIGIILIVILAILIYGISNRAII